MSLNRKQTVGVIGAGVIGLQCALTLLDAGYDVEIVAEILPEDAGLVAAAAPTIPRAKVYHIRECYASAWAGAQWRTHESAADATASKWDLETYHAWMKLVESDHGQNCGITKVEARNYWDSREAQFPPWWSTHVDSFTPIPSSNLPEGTIYGASYQSFAINPPVYLPWLVGQIKSRGGRITRSVITTDSGLEGAVEQVKAITGGDILAIINATGLGAKKLTGDHNMYPVRGQTVLVQGVLGNGGLVTRLGKKPGETVAIMPRQNDGVTVVGVTREEDSWDVSEDKATMTKLVEHAGEVVDITEAKVLHAQVGLRPARKGGARVELEKGGLNGTVVHAYGHAGAGYQNSVGCASEVLRLVKMLQ